MKKQLYKIRDKRDGSFLSLGYNQKQTWLTFPSQVIKENQHIINNIGKENLEIVVFKYVENAVLPLK